MKRLFNDKILLFLCKYDATICCILCLLVLASCSSIKPYGKYQKRWAYAHPFAAIKLKREKSKCDLIYNAVKDAKSLDKYENGGKLDAFRHIFYMAAFSAKVNAKKAGKLGIAHEKDNYRLFLKNKNEDGEAPDSLSCEMDLLNNAIGIEIGKSIKKGTSLVSIRTICMQKIDDGKAYFMKRDSLGNYLTCNGQKIDLNLYKQKWNVPKCLVRK